MMMVVWIWKVIVERERSGGILGVRKKLMWSDWWRGWVKELRIKDGSFLIGKKYTWYLCL